MSTIFATSVVKEKDSCAAGMALGLDALNKMHGEKPDVAVVFGSPDYDYDQVFNSIRSVAGNIQIVGCTSAGEFTEKEVSHGGIACAFISSDTHSFFSGIGAGVQKQQNMAVEDALKDIPKEIPGFPYLSAMLFVDGLCGKGEETMQTASSMLGSNVKLFGGAAADNFRFKKTHVFGAGSTYTDAVSICLVASQKPIICSAKHGHHPISPPLRITKAKDNILYELDGKVALDVSKEYAHEEIAEFDLKKNYSIHDSEALSKYLLKHEAGVVIANDTYKIRFPISCNPDGSLNFVCTIDKNTFIQIMGTQPSDQITSAKCAAKQALEIADGAKIAGLIIFDCACRGMILKERFSSAVDAIKETFPGIPMLGVETYGEIAHENGSCAEFHNTTTVIMLIPE